MFATSSALSVIAGMFTDTGTLIAAVIAGVVAGAVALVGLGFAWRHLTKRVTGKKF